MSQRKYGDFKNANRYQHKALVVLKFEEMKVDGKTQVYATGFDLEKPDQQISVALMQEDGYRKNIAQISFGITEKTDGDVKKYYNTASSKEITKAEYDEFIHTSSAVEQQFNNLISQRANAEGLLAKRLRIGRLPAVLMFDNANKLDQIGGIDVYEARWVSGLSGNVNRLEDDQALEDDFAVSHRKVLGNIRIKYNEADQPVWGDCNAIDRITDLKAPNPANTAEENAILATRNRDILRYALSNVTTSEEGYKVERKPFTYFNLVDTKSEENKVTQTIPLFTEEVADSRHKTDDPIVKFHFKRPKDAADTLEAYMYHQDAQTLPLTKLLQSGEDLDLGDKNDINKAYNADKTRAVISSLLNIKFQPVVTPELAERATDKGLQADIAKKANELKGLHKKLVMGELEPRMINGTTYPLGPKYLNRFTQEVQLTSAGKKRPMRGLVSMQPFENSENKSTEKIMSHENGELIFSEMYICPKKWETTTDTPSVFTGLITTPAQSYDAVVKSRVSHKELTEEHAPTVDSYRFIGVEYKDYIDGTKQVPSIVQALAEEKERIQQLDHSKDQTKEYENFYRLMGIHKVPSDVGVEAKAPAATKEKSKDYGAEFDMS